MFGVAHEVVIALVKSSQPHLHTHTHTLVHHINSIFYVLISVSLKQTKHVLVKIVMICHKRKIRAQGRSRNIKEKCDMIEG